VIWLAQHNELANICGRFSNLLLVDMTLATLVHLCHVWKVVFTANDDANNSCRLLRRGTRFMADADKLLQYSRANIVDDWKRRGADNPRSGLPFICALFEVQILSLSREALGNKVVKRSLRSDLFLMNVLGAD